MATRADAIPGFDILNDDLASADLMRIAQENGVDIEDALRLAREGDVLELELLRSGFYGDTEVPPEVVDQGLALRNLGDLLIRLREAAVERRWGVDEQTLLNFAFNAGHHYIEVDRARRVVVPIPAPRGAVRRKVQKFAPWYRTQHSKRSGGDPQYHVEATTRQQEDKGPAEMAGRIAGWLAEALHRPKHSGRRSAVPRRGDHPPAGGQGRRRDGGSHRALARPGPPQPQEPLRERDVEAARRKLHHRLRSRLRGGSRLPGDDRPRDGRG